MQSEILEKRRRGDFGPDSDADIMILLDISDLELKKYSQ